MAHRPGAGMTSNSFALMLADGRFGISCFVLQSTAQPTDHDATGLIVRGFG